MELQAYLELRRGNTRLVMSGLPIVPSPIASRTIEIELILRLLEISELTVSVCCLMASFGLLSL